MGFLRRFAFAVFAAALTVAGAAAQEAGDFQPGRDYLLIDPPLPVRVPAGKVELIEFFNFSCPHCFRLQRDFNKWKSGEDMSDIALIRQPMVFPRFRGHFARAYYTLESLGVGEKFYGKVFGAIHRDRKLLNSKGRFIDWLEEEGFDAAKAEAAYDSFSVGVKVSRAEEFPAAYGVNSTPQLAVGGKYVVNAALSGTRERMFEILTALVAAERKALAGSQ